MALKRSKTLFLALFLGLSSLWAADWQPAPIGPFSGINNRDNSYAIPAQNAQDALNVDLTPGGKSVRKRKGYGTAYTLSITTSPVHGVYDFFDSNGNEVSLFFNDTRMTASAGASTIVLFSTGPNGATYQCTDSLGFAYCANSQRTTLTKTNGTVAGTSNITSVISTGTMVTTCVTRLAMAGFSDRPSGIDFSGDSNFTSWGTGSLGTSPVQLTINAPGAKITHITYAFGRLMWFKDSSFGYVLIGNQPLQTDWVIKTVAYDVGTNDNSSVYREGILYFRGKDGHIYAFDGNTYERTTREIAATIALSQGRASNAWVQTTASDWGGGLFLPNTYIDTVTTPGAIQFNYPDNFSSYRNGTNSTKDIWKSLSYSATSTSAVVSNGNLVLVSTFAYEQYARTNYPSANYKQGTTYYCLISSITPNPSSANIFTVYFSSISSNLPFLTSPSDLNDYLFFQFRSTESQKIYLNSIKSSNDGFLCSVCNVAAFSVPATLEMWISTTNYQVKINNTLVKAGAFTYTNNQLYTYLGMFTPNITIPGYAYVDTFGIAPETSTFYTSVNNAPNLTSWDTFNTISQMNGGSQSFFIRGSTNPISVNSSTPTWTSAVDGAIPTISTSSYFQFRDDFLLSSAPAAGPLLDSLTQNWFEGLATDKAYATYFDDRIWWSVAYGTGATTNNAILLYDMLNKTWLPYDLASNGFYINQNSLYFGSALGGYIYQYGSGDSDNGAAINSYWKSKDFYGTDPFIDQDLVNLSVVTASVANSSMTVTYGVNNSSFTSYTVPLFSSRSSFKVNNKNLPSTLISADTFNVRIGNNAANQPWEVFGIQFGVRPKTWNPKQ